EHEVLADLRVDQAALERTNGGVECWACLAGAPPVLPIRFSVVLISFWFDLATDDFNQIWPAFGLFKRQVTEADHIAVIPGARTRVHILAAEVGEDALRVLGAARKQLLPPLWSQDESHTQDDSSLKITS